MLMRQKVLLLSEPSCILCFLVAAGVWKSEKASKQVNSSTAADSTVSDCLRALKPVGARTFGWRLKNYYEHAR